MNKMKGAKNQLCAATSRSKREGRGLARSRKIATITSPLKKEEENDCKIDMFSINLTTIDLHDISRE